jgi:DNA-binding CsgD family transcriptional regulator
VLYGRDVERARIWGLLEAARSSRSGALVLRGEAGIGKSALLEDARDRAADMHVLGARGIESESELPFAALHQLLRPALTHADRLPAPQSAALRSALGLGGAAHERFLVFAACLTLLSELAERRPVLCIVDDAHWLDSASADALQFVARRLDAEGIVLLFGAREGDVRRFEAVDIPSLSLRGLDAEAANDLLAGGSDVSPAVRELLVEQTRGNALALVELPSALTPGQLAGEEPLPEALPLTSRLEHVFHARVRELPEDTRRVLLVAAADESEDAGLVARAAERLGVRTDALDPAEEAKLVTVHGTRFEFRHPLVRSAVYGAATSSERRAAHAALAEVLADDPRHADRRAWHLASATFEHDEDVALALEAAAGRAEGRAGHVAAAKALARAAELSAEPAARRRRLIGAVRAARVAGADDYAFDLSSQAGPFVDDPELRAEIAYAGGVAAFRRGRPLDGLPSLIAAARDVGGTDPDKALELLIWATGAATTGGDQAALLEISELAAATALEGGDTGSAFVADALAAVAHVRRGDAAAHRDRVEAALAWASTAEDPWRVFSISVATLFLGDDRRSGALIGRAVSLARANGQFGVLAEALAVRAVQLRMGQRFEEAEIAAGEGLQFARELGAVNVAARCMGILAFIAAVRGDDVRARTDAGEALEVAAAHGLPPVGGSAIYALAMVDLGRGRWVDALERLHALTDGQPTTTDPVQAAFALPDTIEAAVRAGRRTEAAEALSAYEAWEARSAAVWQRPRLECCRALLSDGAEATAHFEEALRLRADARPFDFARILLLYGEHLRRERRRTASRVQLRAALEAFEHLRAEPWAERARTELRASGETARRRDPSAVDQLTPQELQITGFVAEGLTNKEIAAQLFLSPRTIDSHLRNVFAKLGVTSRTQLARMRLEADESEAVAPV